MKKAMDEKDVVAGMMREAYYWKSLICTFLVCLILAGIPAVFVFLTGLTGVLLLALTFLLFLVYFYGGFRKILNGSLARLKLKPGKVPDTFS